MSEIVFTTTEQLVWISLGAIAVGTYWLHRTNRAIDTARQYGPGDGWERENL